MESREDRIAQEEIERVRRHVERVRDRIRELNAPAVLAAQTDAAAFHA